MSDYYRRKVISYPINEKEFCEKFGIEEIYDFEDVCQCDKFEIECVIDYEDKSYPLNYYLEYLLDSSYGDGCSEFSRSRFLSEQEQEKYKPLFEKVIGEIDASKLKYADYCWYNCCEAQDYYIKEDDFNKEV